MTNKVTAAFATILFFNATPAAAQLDAEGMGLMKALNECIEASAFEKDDGVKSPGTIADLSMAACRGHSIEFEQYAVRHSAKMTDALRTHLRNIGHGMAIKFVMLNREAGRIHAPNR